MPNSISTHVSAFIALVVSAVAALHPGFTLNPTITETLVTVGTLGALVLELCHVNLKTLVVKYQHDLDVLGATLTKDVPAPVLAAAKTVAETALAQAETVIKTPEVAVVPAPVTATAVPSTAPPVVATAEPSLP